MEWLMVLAAVLFIVYAQYSKYVDREKDKTDRLYFKAFLNELDIYHQKLCRESTELKKVHGMLIRRAGLIYGQRRTNRYIRDSIQTKSYLELTDKKTCQQIYDRHVFTEGI